MLIVVVFYLTITGLNSVHSVKHSKKLFRSYKTEKNKSKKDCLRKESKEFIKIKKIKKEIMKDRKIKISKNKTMSILNHL